LHVGGEEIVGGIEAECETFAGIAGDGGEEIGVVAVDDQQALGI
jgi:hypothetical protein